MIANLDKIHEMHKLLSNKNRVNDDLLSLFGRFGLGQAFRRLGMERQQGVSALQRIISLFLFWFNGESIFSIYRKDFHSHLQTGKNYFAIYQIRWSIEVFLKESKGYFGFGKYQALDLSRQYNMLHDIHGHGVGHTAERLRYIQKTFQGTKARPYGTNALAKGAGYHQKNHERSR